jgi:catechol 2,3-dioxygenase-like lactoylglutathione lyase family enzyme
MQQTTTKITHIGRVIIPVSDQDRALEFYVEKLGFEKRADIPFGDGDRWLEVAPAGAVTGIAIVHPRPGNSPGGDQTCIAFETEDLDADHATLRDLGVDVDDLIGGDGTVPRMFFFRDLDGNNLLAVEQQQ